MLQPPIQNRGEDFDLGGDNSGTYEVEGKEMMRLQFEVDDILDDFEHRVLRGEKKVVDIKSGQVNWVPMTDNKLINEEGVRQLMSRLVGKVTRAAKLSWKSEEEIYKDMFYFHLSIVELVSKKCDEWEMDIEFAKSTVDAMIDLVWDITASSRNGFTAVNLKSQYSRSDISRVDSQGKGEGGRSFLGIKLGGK